MYAGNQAIKGTKKIPIYHIINTLRFTVLSISNTIEYKWIKILNATAPNSVYNQLLGWWVANQNQNTKQKHPSLNFQRHRNWIRKRSAGATGHTRGRWVS